MFNTLFLIVLALAPDQDLPPFGFKGLELYKTDSRALGLITADFNRDGRLDFALANNSRSRIEVFLQKSPHQMKADQARPTGRVDVNEIHDDARFKKILIPLESTVHALVAGDLDGDGAPEMAFRAVPSFLVILKRHEGERWETARKFKIKEGNGSRTSLLAADLNGDDRLDLALLGKDGLSLFYQNDRGHLVPPEFFPTSLKNATGLDFVRPRSGRPALVLFRLGFENGIAIRPLLETSLGPEWIFKTGKMNTVFFPPGEDTLSLVSVSRVSDRLHRKVVDSREKDGTLLETPLSLYPLTEERGLDERRVAVGDLNGDELKDVVVSRPGSASLKAFLQGKDGYFLTPRTSSTFAGTSGIQVGDFNRDGKADVLVVSPEERVVGLATMENDRLTFPKSIAGIEGKPCAAAGAALLHATGMDLAVVSEKKRKYFLTVVPGFSEKPIHVPLAFLEAKPTRLLAVDIDNDGDQDLAVITRRDPFGLILNEGKGKFTPLGSDAFGGKWLLQDVDAGSYSPGVLEDGRQAILVAKKTLGRAVGLNKDRKLEILEQMSAGENTKLKGIVRSGKEVVVVDEKSSSLILLRKKGGEWKRLQEIELPSNLIRSIEAVALGKGGEKDLILSEKSGFIILRRGRKVTRLKTEWSYESDVKEASLWLVTQGDLNADGRKDLVVTDYEKRAIELLVPPDPSGKVKRGLRFEVFEERQKSGRRSNHIREMVAADLTGDGKDDLLFLLHDRVVLYPQE